MIVDIKGMGLLNLPFGMIKAVLHAMQSQYVGVTMKSFILNSSFGFKMVWQTIKAFLDDMILKKVMLTNESTCDELKNLMHPS